MVIAKKIKIGTGFGLILISVLLLASCSRDPLNETIKSHSSIENHIHPSIEISILGENYRIPANVGIQGNGMRYVHTHDSSGELHIESPYYYPFTIKDFFYIWGVQFNNTCVFDYCEDGDHSFKVYVNSREVADPENTVMLDNDRIQIIFEKK